MNRRPPGHLAYTAHAARAALAWVLVCAAAATPAAEILVTSPRDPVEGDPDPGLCPSANNCTLRRAIEGAATGDTIRFAPQLGNAAVIQLTRPLRVDMDAALSVTVQGPGVERLHIRGHGLPADPSGWHRVLEVSGGGLTRNISDAWRFTGLTLTQGGNRGAAGDPAFDMGRGGDATGGCVQIEGGALVLEDVAVRDCALLGGRGANGANGAVSGARDGKPGAAGGNALGGAIYIRSGSLRLLGTSVAYFEARGGEGGNGGRGGDSFTPINPPGSGGDGGHGGDVAGGALWVGGGARAVLQNSTLVAGMLDGGDGGAGGSGGNAGGGGEGRGGRGGTTAGGVVHMETGSTLELVFASVGPVRMGIGAPGAGLPPGDVPVPGAAAVSWSGTGFTLRHSLLMADTEHSACSAAVIDASGWNLASDPSCAGVPQGNAELVLEDGTYGLEDGREVMRPRRGGALIDRIDAWECTTPLSVVVVRDQQGWPRPQDSDGDGVAGCEPGAYELPYDPTLMRDGFERPFARRR